MSFKRKRIVLNTLIEALGNGFQDGGVEYSFNYPGFHSNELHFFLGGDVTSVNEYCAYSSAWGAAFAGKRSVVSMKNVGLSACADAFLNSMLLGINAGLVLVVFDDCDVQHSQCRLDSRHYFDFYGGLWFDPFNIQNAYEIARNSFKFSEEFNCPVVIRVTNILYDMNGLFTRISKLQLSVKTFVRSPEKFVVHPMNALKQEKALTNRQEKIQSYIENIYSDLSLLSRDIVYGASRNMLAQDFVQIYTLPIPLKLFEKTKDESVCFKIYEHGDAYITEKIRSHAGSSNFKHFSLNASGENFEYHNRSDFENLFSLLRNVNNRVICGDLGGFTMDPSRSIDACLAYGASVSIAMGVSMASPDRNVFCVCGDAGFKHSAMLVLHEAVQRKLHFSVIVLDNGGSEGTGGQQIPGNWDNFPKGVTLKHLNFSELKLSGSNIFESSNEDNDTGVKVFIIKLI